MEWTRSNAYLLFLLCFGFWTAYLEGNFLRPVL
jgi:hypothetical protein